MTPRYASYLARELPARRMAAQVALWIVAAVIGAAGVCLAACM